MRRLWRWLRGDDILPVRIIDPSMPEARTPIFLDWLRDQGVDPRIAYRVDVQRGYSVIHVYVRGEDGRILLTPTQEPLVDVVRVKAEPA